MVAKFRYRSKNSVIAKIENFSMHSNFRYHRENSVIAKIEIFAIHNNICYDSENPSAANVTPRPEKVYSTWYCRGV